ncbi:uncharacterized protein LOC126894826 isoform X3 [Daktulosphaira vitifoliae]|uniref:uncharacterized protein LOC126894826 isoform X3 n=1 Tax=Daktulosphaira vitifoliae TaxID=58002 RepID=UPI0021A99F02|nr:uncharacterized protein LOC126894826 isoform X3 [Daktulosphaira vitifoliae]
MNPHFIKFVTLYFILSKALSSSIITSEENNDELNNIKEVVSVYKEPVEVPCVICNENKPNRNISSKCLHYYCKKCTREKILANEWCTLCAEYLDTSILISCLN